jgi:7,8-didemethyl-8-hydroxy-5-deazariboflavin synthase
VAKSFISKGRHQTPVNLIAGASSQGQLIGGSIEKSKALELMAECDTAVLLDLAGRIRNRTRPNNIITYSRKVFINLVNLCRDNCTYCTYKKEPGDSKASLMKPAQVLAIAEAGKALHCTEALFVTGERPEQKYSEASDWLRSLGHASTVEYIAEMSDMVLNKTGLLPHTNAGSLTKKEISLLKETNVSLGVMLESSSERLLGIGMPHEDAPSKNPKVRIKTLENAGQLKVPMTTGILVGIGETADELVDSLYAIKQVQDEYRNIQEVIMQNFAPKPETAMALASPPSQDYFLRAVSLARLVMPEMNIQVPPNLTPTIYGRYLDAGINDWGGISPLTIDHVNPEFPWPDISTVKAVTEKKGKKLRARLPIYPEFVKGGFITSRRLQSAVELLSDRSGLVSEGYTNE